MIIIRIIFVLFLFSQVQWLIIICFGSHIENLWFIKLVVGVCQYELYGRAAWVALSVVANKECHLCGRCSRHNHSRLPLCLYYVGKLIVYLCLLHKAANADRRCSRSFTVQIIIIKYNQTTTIIDNDSNCHPSVCLCVCRNWVPLIRHLVP